METNPLCKIVDSDAVVDEVMIGKNRYSSLEVGETKMDEVYIAGPSRGRCLCREDLNESPSVTLDW